MASDPEHDPLVWSLESGPGGMALDPLRGLLRWTPTLDQLGSHEVTVRVYDDHGASATQTYVVAVRAVNTPPLIRSAPPTTAAFGQTYLYNALASDLDDDRLTFRLAEAPTGMSIDQAHWPNPMDAPARPNRHPKA